MVGAVRSAGAVRPKYFQQVASPPAGDVGLIEDFSDDTDWAIYSSGSSGDHEHLLDTAHVRHGAASVRFLQNTSGTVRRLKYFAGGLDFSQADTFTLVGYFPEGEGEDSITLFMSSDGEGTLANYYQISLGATAAGNARRGWTCWTFMRSQFSANNSPDWSNITNIMFSINSLDAGEYITLDSLHFGVRARPQILFTFDDGAETQWEAAVEANSHGIPLLISPIQSLVNGAGYLTTTELRALAAAGNEIGCHSGSQFPDETDSGYAIMVAARDYVQRFGTSHGHVIVYPGGRFNKAVQSAARRAGFRAGRSIVGQSYDAGPPEKLETLGNTQWESIATGLSDLFNIAGPNLNSNVNLATAQGYVDTAIARGMALIFYGHKIDTSATSDTWATADWAALCAYVEGKRQQGLCDTPTFSKFLDGLGVPPSQ